MKATVHLYGRLRRFSQPGSPGVLGVDIPDGATIEDLIARIGIDRKEIMASAVNGRTCALDRRIKENDDVHLIAQLGGA